MLLDYFGNSSMLSMYQFFLKKSHDRKDLLSTKFSDKCRKDFPQNFRRPCKVLKGQPQKRIGLTQPFFPLASFTSSFPSVEFHGEAG